MGTSTYLNYSCCTYCLVITCSFAFAAGLLRDGLTWHVMMKQVATLSLARNNLSASFTEGKAWVDAIKLAVPMAKLDLVQTILLRKVALTIMMFW